MRLLGCSYSNPLRLTGCDLSSYTNHVSTTAARQTRLAEAHVRPTQTLGAEFRWSDERSGNSVRDGLHEVAEEPCSLMVFSAKMLERPTN